MDLVPYIFFEKQEPGTSLCGQHALNNVLQSHYFEATDLADVAQQLDAEENDTLDDDRTESVNMDDTGFFSVQVLDRCLQVWGLKLERWRSEEMKPHWDQPELQDAFILNLSQHWFPLRKFASTKRWYNLNSFNEAPQHVSELYLGMTLGQAETEGYSIFVLRPNEPVSSTSAAATEPSILQTSRADRVAAELGAPESKGSGTAGGAHATIASGSTSNGGVDWAAYGNFDDEDAELRAALAASLASAGGSPPPSAPPSRPISSLPSRPPSARQASVDADDPVAASRARSQRLLEQFQQDQAAALRGEDPAMALRGFGAPSQPSRSGENGRAGSGSGSGTSSRDETIFSARRRRQADPEPVPAGEDDDDDNGGVEPSLPIPPRRSSTTSRSPRPAAQVPRRHDEDEEMMRQAIEASLREQEARDQSAVSSGARTAMDVADDDDDQEILDDDDDDGEIQIDYDDGYDFADDAPSAAAARPPHLPVYADGLASFGSMDRNYDEEDAELQAAIRASMEGLPEDYRAPSLPAPPPLPSPFIARPAPPPTAPAPEPVNTAAPDGDEDDEDEADEAEAPALTPEQIRALRLARFG